MSPRGNPRDVLLTFSNGGGWSSAGASTLLGVITQLSWLCGYDSSVHITENAKDASSTNPFSLMTSCALSGILAFIVGITIIFCLGNLEEVLSNPNQAPFITVLLYLTGNRAATVALYVPIVLCFMSALISKVATASRQLWSFARDGSLPFSKFLEPVPDAEVLRRAVWTTIAFTLVLSCVNFGPV
ncbi:hypothetical protein LTR02_017174, partial [Friedmanniomyces endolithicus]